MAGAPAPLFCPPTVVPAGWEPAWLEGWCWLAAPTLLSLEAAGPDTSWSFDSRDCSFTSCYKGEVISSKSDPKYQWKALVSFHLPSFAELPAEPSSVPQRWIGYHGRVVSGRLPKQRHSLYGTLPRVLSVINILSSTYIKMIRYILLVALLRTPAVFSSNLEALRWCFKWDTWVYGPAKTYGLCVPFQPFVRPLQLWIRLSLRDWGSWRSA